MQMLHKQTVYASLHSCTLLPRLSVPSHTNFLHHIACYFGYLSLFMRSRFVYILFDVFYALHHTHTHTTAKNVQKWSVVGLWKLFFRKPFGEVVFLASFKESFCPHLLMYTRIAAGAKPSTTILSERSTEKNIHTHCCNPALCIGAKRWE